MPKTSNGDPSSRGVLTIPVCYDEHAIASCSTPSPSSECSILTPTKNVVNNPRTKMVALIPELGFPLTFRSSRDCWLSHIFGHEVGICPALEVGSQGSPREARHTTPVKHQLSCRQYNDTKQASMSHYEKSSMQAKSIIKWRSVWEYGHKGEHFRSDLKICHRAYLWRKPVDLSRVPRCCYIQYPELTSIKQSRT